MKNTTKHTLLAALAGLASASVHAAPLVAGDKIGIDFGPTATANWNNITADGQSIAAGALINRAGTSLDGVSLTTAKGAGTGYFNNNDGSDNWVGLKSPLPADFVDSVTTDIAGVSGGTDTYTITLSGLSTSLRYHLWAVSTAAAGGTRQDSFTVAGDISYGPSTILRSTSHGSGAFHTFSNVGANGAGVLTITLTDLSTGNNPIVNGILIKAVEPPSRWILNGDGNWNTAANWSPNTVPNAPAATAMLDSDEGQITGPVTATLDVPVTLGSLQFNHFEPYTVAGTNALTFDNAGGGGGIQVVSGGHLISAPVTMAEAMAVTVATGAALELSGTLSDGGNAFGLVKSGTGNLVLAGDFSGFTGLTTISGGTVTLPRAGDYTLTHQFAGAGRLAFTGGGRVTLEPFAFNSHGGTNISNGTTLAVAGTFAMGTAGGIGFDDGTLEVTGNITAGTAGWFAQPGGGVIEVGADLTLQGGGLTGTGTMNKTGAGTWRIAPGGGGVTIGTLTVSGGVLDLDRNDTFGNHSGSGQHLVIESGAVVTNGILVNRGYNAFRTVTLNGGELRVSGSARALVDGDLFKFEAYGIRHSITVTGTAPSSITNPGALANAGINIGDVTNLGGGAGADLTLEVADVTGSDEADLTVSAVLKNNYTAGTFAPLANGLVKTGDGTLELTALNRYTGATSVEAGTLILGQPFLADGADVKLTSGATLQLDFAGTDTIDELFIDGMGQATGTWGRPDHPTAEHTTSLIAGDGLLEVTTEPPVGYAGWAGLFAGFTATNPDLDFENDGLASGIEWVVGGDPTANDAATVAPFFDNKTDPGDFLFTFRRRDDAATDPGTTIVVEYGSNLTGWTEAGDGINGVTIDDTTDLGGGFHQVTVAIPRALAAGGKLFARLRVTIAP